MNTRFFNKKENGDFSIMAIDHAMIAITNYGNTWFVPSRRFFAGLSFSVIKKSDKFFNLRVQVPSDGKAILVRDFQFSSYSKARKFRDKILSSLRDKKNIAEVSVKKTSKNWFFRAILICLIVLGSILLIPTNKETVVRAYHTDKIRADGYLEEDQLQALREIAVQHGIALSPHQGTTAKDTVYVISSGSGCSDCQQMDEIVTRLTDDIKTVVLPMYVKGVSADNFLTEMGQLYCQTHPDEAWKMLSSGESIIDTGIFCEESTSRILTSSILSVFVETHIGKSESRTSIVIAPNGAYHVGAIEMDAPSAPWDELEKWIKANSVAGK